MPSVLLHLCCGPCCLMPVKLLREEGFTVTGVFYNPNIHPLGEYLKRREAVRLAALRLKLPLLAPEPAEAAWDLRGWLHTVSAGDKAARCRACCALRLEFTARWARSDSGTEEPAFDSFSTSLLYSRRQPHETVAEEGEKAARRWGTPFLYRDFRPAWREGIRLSKEWGLYRQNYCGCLYSEAERYGDALRTEAETEGVETRSVPCPGLDTGAPKA